MCHWVTINVLLFVTQCRNQGANMPENATELLERPAEAGSADEAKAAEITSVDPVEVVASDLLVEEISIDGMCGVY